MHTKKKSGIALLITLMFVISITAAIGISLAQVNKLKKSVLDETFMVQTSVLLDDVLNILKNSKELASIIDINASDKAREAYFIFLEQAAFIPFESSGIEVLIEIKSARSKFNPNTFIDYNSTGENKIHKKKLEYFQEYLNMKRVDYSYADILLDSMSEIKEDFSYFSDIFIQKPYLFRDYISSQKHLEEINEFYLKAYHNINIENINSQELFYYKEDLNSTYTIDLNQATKETFELILLCGEERAEKLSEENGLHKNIDDMLLSDEEKEILESFLELSKENFYQPILDVKIEFIENRKNAIIRFEYDIKQRKGSNFVYEI